MITGTKRTIEKRECEARRWPFSNWTLSSEMSGASAYQE